MTETFKPRDATEVATAVSWAVSEARPLEIVGAGSKRALGRPAQSEHTLDVSGLSGITLYEPEELVLTAAAGTPIREIHAALAARGQELAFEPMDYGPLLGHPSGEGTIGGILATNLSGPRRIAKGAARDHALGIAAVSGRGEAFKSGGRVVKNVTGYDLSRGLAGSWGTLAVLTSVTFKVLPRAETSLTLALSGLDDAKAAAAMAAAMGSSAEASGAAHLPAAVAGTVDGLGPRAATLIRLEGIPVSVAARADALAKLLGAFGPVGRIDRAASERIWVALRDVEPFATTSNPGAPVWRISVAPSAGAALARAIGAAIPAARWFYDWQGGLVWLMLPPRTPHAGAMIVRDQTRAAGGGHAFLVRADAAVRAAVPVFEPQPAPLAALSARLKAQFDPKGILNPGRMTAGL
jgi:glycolate oxidase FAD binding subunit